VAASRHADTPNPGEPVTTEQQPHTPLLWTRATLNSHTMSGSVKHQAKPKWADQVEPGKMGDQDGRSRSHAESRHASGPRPVREARESSQADSTADGGS
jgi:hypothetical protein